MPLRTTRRTLNKNCTSLDFQRLPPTFQDAVTITRVLGIRYLWIDALYIVQDDKDDWLDQASKMGSIFHKSLVTIAAHSATDSLDGFLWRREVPNFLSIQTQRFGHYQNDAFYTRIRMISDYAVSRTFTNCQITRRAWVLQELCLSPRILHFVEDRIIWECAHRPIKIEEYTEKTPADLFRLGVSHPAEYWLRLVAQYSASQMTKSSDKLVAITGIANVWPTLVDSTQDGAYYCGIFDNDVHNSLSWLKENQPVLRRVGRAPTWSWASVDGEIQFIQHSRGANTRLISDIEIVAFDIGGGKAAKREQVSGYCPIQLRAIAKDGVEVAGVSKSKYLPFCPSGRLRYHALLRNQSEDVGWAALDEDCRQAKDADFTNIRGLMISIIAVRGKTCGFYVLIVKPCRRRISTYLRIGMGRIYDITQFDQLHHETVTLV